MSLRVNTNVEAFDAHRNLSGNADEACRRACRSSRPAFASTAPRTTPPVLPSPRRCAARSTAPHRHSATQWTASRSSRPQKVHTTRCTRSSSASASSPCRRRTARCPSADTGAIDQEVGQLTAELTRIAGNTQFNSLQVLSGSFTLQVGADAGSGNQISFSLSSISFSSLSSSAAAGAISAIDQAITSVSSARSTLGDPEPPGARRQQPRRLPGEHHRSRVAHPRRRHRGGDGQLHQAPDPLPVRYRDARSGELGTEQRALPAPRLESGQRGREVAPWNDEGPGCTPGPSRFRDLARPTIAAWTSPSQSNTRPGGARGSDRCDRPPAPPRLAPLSPASSRSSSASTSPTR